MARQMVSALSGRTLLWVLLLILLPACAPLRSQVRTAGMDVRCAAGKEQRRGTAPKVEARTAVPVPATPDDSLRRSTKAAAEIRCNRALRR